MFIKGKIERIFDDFTSGELNISHMFDVIFIETDLDVDIMYHAMGEDPQTSEDFIVQYNAVALGCERMLIQ